MRAAHGMTWRFGPFCGDVALAVRVLDEAHVDAREGLAQLDRLGAEPAHLPGVEALAPEGAVAGQRERGHAQLVGQRGRLGGGGGRAEGGRRAVQLAGLADNGPFAVFFASKELSAVE